MNVKPITAGPETFCRLCLTQHQSYYPLFETEGAQMLESLTSMKVSIDDPAPNFACPKCFLDLVKAYNIQQRLVAVETSLQTRFAIIKHEPIKEEPVDEEPSQSDLLENCGRSERFQNTVYIILQKPIKEEPVESRDDPNIQTDAVSESCEPVKKFQNLTVNCRLCPKEISYPEYRTHLATHSDGFCEYCGTTCKNAHALRKHVLIYHREPKRHCDKCNLQFDNLKSYDVHVRRVHTGQASYICEICGRQYFIKTQLNKHMRVQHLGMDKRPCEICGKQLRKEHIEQHKLVHTGEKPFVCEFCGRGFAFKCNMNLHKTKVHGWKDAVNYKCSTCGKGFSGYLALTVHMKVHSTNKV